MLRRPPRSTLFPYTRSSDLAKGARKEIAMIKAVVPSMLNGVVDRAMQVFGAMGLTPDTPLADLWISSRCLRDRKSTRLNSSHVRISYAVFCLKKKNKTRHQQ